MHLIREITLQVRFSFSQLYASIPILIVFYRFYP